VKVSVVVPVFNPVGTLLPLVKRTVDVMREVADDWEIILVDDGSKEIIKKEIKLICEQFKKTKGIFLQGNFGQHNATMCGIHHATGDYIITIDDDMTYFPEDIPLLIRECQKYDNCVVYGVNADKDTLLRKLTKRILWVVSQISGMEYVVGSSFRCIPRSIADKLKTVNSSIVFLESIIKWYSERVVYVNVRVNPPGWSRYDATRSLSFLSGISFMYSFVPIRVVSLVGVAFAIIAFIISLFLIGKKIFFRAHIGYTSLMVAIMGGSGLIMASIGIIGEYIYRIILILLQKPPYIIKEIYDNSEMGN